MKKKRFISLMLYMVIASLLGSLFFPITLTGETSSPLPKTRASHDLSLNKIDVLPNMVGDRKYYPGMEVVIYVDVMNEGTAGVPPSESFEVILVVDDMLDNVTTLTARSYGLPAGMNKTIIFKVHLPAHPTYDLPHSYNLVATVNYGLDEDKSNNQLIYPSAITVYSPSIFKPRIEVPPDYQHIQVTLTGEGKPTSVPISFILKNDANVDDAITFEYVNVPEQWMPPPPPDFVNLPPKSNKTYTNWWVTIPGNLKYAQNEVDYVIEIRPYSLFYPYGDYPTAEIHFSIDFVPGARITPYETEKYVTPGRRESVRFNVTNTGNGPDIFDFALVLDSNAIKYGWKITLQTRTLYNPLSPGESADVVVMVTCPTTVPKNSNTVLKLKAISQKAPEYTSESIIGMRIYAGTYVAASFEKEEYLLHLLPGEVNRFIINITNDGNGLDYSLRVHAEGSPLGWAINIDQSPLFAGVGPRTTVPLQVSIYVPPTSRSGYQYFELVITGGERDATLAVAEVTAQVKSSYGVLLSADSVLKKGFVGSDVTFTLTIRNMGNIEDTFTITENHPTGWETELDFEKVVDLPENFTTDILYRVVIPRGTPADADRSTPALDPYPLKITAVSENDTAVSYTLILFVEVQPYYHFRFFVKDPVPILFNADDPDSFLLFNVYAENLGNFMESIRFDLVDNFYSWVQLKTLYTAIGYGQTGKAILQFAPPPGMEPGYYNITLKGTVTENPDVVREIKIPLYFYRLDFTVNSIWINNTLYDPQNPPEVSINREYAIRVNITNNGTIDYTIARMPQLYVGLYISGGIPVERQKVSYLPRGGFAEVVFTWSPQLLGENQLIIKVDDTSDVPEYNENNNTVQISVKVPKVEPPGPPKSHNIPLWLYLVLFLLLVGLLLSSLYFYRMANSIIISPFELGYDESGAYNPAAAKAVFEEGERDVTKTAAEGIGPRSPLAGLPGEKPTPALAGGSAGGRGALPAAAPAPAQPRPAVAAPPKPSVVGAAARPAPQRPLQARIAPGAQPQRPPGTPTPSPGPQAVAARPAGSYPPPRGGVPAAPRVQGAPQQKGTQWGVSRPAARPVQPQRAPASAKPATPPGTPKGPAAPVTPRAPLTPRPAPTPVPTPTRAPPPATKPPVKPPQNITPQATQRGPETAPITPKPPSQPKPLATTQVEEPSKPPVEREEKRTGGEEVKGGESEKPAVPPPPPPPPPSSESAENKSAKGEGKEESQN